MKILLTGARGFTGRYFEQAALAAGHAVEALDADVTDRAAVRARVLTVYPEAVVHLAGISFVGHGSDSELFAVNTVGTANLLDALAALPVVPKKIVVASSANVYGNCAESPIKESVAPAPVNSYAISKVAMEYSARVFMDRLPIVMARPFNYTGPGQSRDFVIPKLVAHYARKLPEVELGNLDVEREFNDVRMVCEAYMALLMHGTAGEIYNICSGKPYTLREVMSALSELAGYVVEPKITAALLRSNEVHRLCGDPTKLMQLCERTDVGLQQPSLRDMLSWMLEAARS